MAVIVTGFRVRAGKQTYLKGEVVQGLSKAEEARLVSEGHCRYPETVPTAEKGKDPSKDKSKPNAPENKSDPESEQGDGSNDGNGSSKDEGGPETGMTV